MPVPTWRLPVAAAALSLVVLLLPLHPAWVSVVGVDGVLLAVAVTDWLLAVRPAAVSVTRELPGIVPLNGRAEVDKRRLIESWSQFGRERHEWQDKRKAGDAAAAAQVRDLARRAKAVAVVSFSLESLVDALMGATRTPAWRLECGGFVHLDTHATPGAGRL